MADVFAYLEGFGTSGDRLKLRIFSGTSAPSNPKDNDIWVNTNVAIPSWEFSETANPTWTMSNGFVYFTSTYTGAYDARATTGLNFIKKDNTIYTKLLRCTQYAGGTWYSRDAYIYHDGWHQFSSVFSATINITYPAGSTCTCSNGSTTLTAPNTSGTWACTVPNTGTWTVKATDGTKRSTASVTITADGETKSVTLAFELKLTSDYWNGDIGWIVTSWPEGSKTSACIFTKTKIDLTSYSTLSFTHSQVKGSSGLTFHVATSTSTGTDKKPNNSVASKYAGSRVNTMDVSSLSGSYYLAINVIPNYGTSATNAVADVVLT